MTADLTAYHADMHALPCPRPGDAEIDAMAAWFADPLRVGNRSDTLPAHPRSCPVPPSAPTAAEAFAEHRRAVDAMATRFAACYRLEPDEVRAEAYYQFLRIYQRYRPERGALGPRVGYLVRRRLHDW